MEQCIDELIPLAYPEMVRTLGLEDIKPKLQDVAKELKKFASKNGQPKTAKNPKGAGRPKK